MNYSLFFIFNQKNKSEKVFSGIIDNILCNNITIENKTKITLYYLPYNHSIEFTKNKKKVFFSDIEKIIICPFHDIFYNKKKYSIIKIIFKKNPLVSQYYLIDNTTIIQYFNEKNKTIIKKNIIKNKYIIF